MTPKNPLAQNDVSLSVILRNSDDEGSPWRSVNCRNKGILRYSQNDEVGGFRSGIEPYSDVLIFGNLKLKVH